MTIQMPDHIYEGYTNEGDAVRSEGHNFVEIDRIEIGNGIDVFVKGCPYPKRGFMIPEAIEAANVAKRALMLMLNPLMLVGWRRNKERFERLASSYLSRFYLRERYMTPVCREICRLPFGETARIIGHIFEYDTAYRYRLQDIMSECSRESLLSNPYAEMSYLLDLLIERETNPTVRAKFRRMRPFLLLLIPLREWAVPILREMDTDAMRMDDADRYWTSTGGDYWFGGRDPKLSRRPEFVHYEHP